MKKYLSLLVAMCASINSFSQEYNTATNYDTINFESPDTILKIDTASQNIWQIGIPDKLYFDSAYSNPKAIVTDTINYYPKNNHSFFDIYIGHFNYPSYPSDVFIEFKHKFDTDTLKDGGFITVSYDKGKNWMNIINDSIYGVMTPGEVHHNLYSNNDTLFNGEKGFSGKSNNWVTTWFGWHYMLVKKAVQFADTMIVRFNFISDNIDNHKEGWLIDNIRLYAAVLPGAINQIGNADLIKLYPNPVNSYLFIDLERNYKNIKIELSDILGKVRISHNYTDKKLIRIDGLNLSAGIYNIKITLDNEFIVKKHVVVK